MNKLHITNITTKEKELALSLLRIPLNFFADNGEKIKTENPKDNKNVNSSSSVPDAKVELGENKSAHINISKDIELDLEMPSISSTRNQEKTTTPSPSISETSSSEKEKNPQAETTTPSTSPETPPQSNNSAHQETKPETPQQNPEPEPVKSEDNDNNDNNQPQQPIPHESAPSSGEPEEKTHSQAPTSKVNNSSDEPEQKTTTPSSDKKQKPSSQDAQSDKKEKTPSPKSQQEKEQKTGTSKEQSRKDKKASASKEQSEKDKKAEDLKKQYANRNPLAKARDKANQKIDGAKKQLGNKIAQNPTAQKALGALDKVNTAKETIDKTKDAIQNLNADKMQEAVGDVAVQAAAKAGDAVVPGLGKAIDVVDKTVGKTEIGKKAKKGIGACCCTCGCITPIILILLPIVFIMQSFSWITNLFGRDNTIYGDDIVNELSTSDYELLEEASVANSMQSYTDLTTNLTNPNILASILGFASDYPIQEALEEYKNHRYQYSENQTDSKYNELKPSVYNEKYKNLIDAGYLFPVAEGDLTSFGMAFDILKENYTVYKLKAPTSAPKRTKIVDGEEIIYTTFNPKGIHQALFQDVLTNIDGLKKRFDGQVDKKWFNEIGEVDENGNALNENSILDKKYDVYIESLDETRELSLRDLFTETSTSAYDTEYYASLVNTILTKYSTQNAEIIGQYDELVDRLAMLELMTYMLAYQKYYEQLTSFVDSYSRYDNIEMFDPNGQGKEFWGQFLTFSNVEYYLALSSLTDHSFTYEIAIASINTSLNTIDVDIINKNNSHFIGIRKFENWYATYYFEPDVINFTYYISVTPPICEPSHIQEYLFDKYNIGFGLFDNDFTIDNDPTLTAEEKVKKKSLKNQNAFFAIFEAATGIQMSKLDDAGNLQTPIYDLDTTGISRSRYFPLPSTTQARVSNAYGQTYSSETVAKFGLSHTDHTGIDYAVASGTTVFATSSGTAYVSRGNTGYGNYVKILHDDGYTSIYAHGNGTFYINNGARVVSGQPIMQSGNSGNSTGPHLHFEVRNPSGSTVNPTSYIYGNA